VPVVAALFAAAEAGLLAWSIGAGAVVLAVSTYFRVREGVPAAFPLSYESVSNLALIAAAIALGSSVRSRRIRVAQQAEITRLTAEQAARETELRVRAERERISRDLHDTVGHTMSVISLQAGVAADALAPGDPAAEAVQRIREAASRTLRDLGSMVRILRAGGPAADPAVLSLAAVPDLVDVAGGAGVEVTADIAVAPGELAPPVDAAAYRVVQEAVTNVVKHAGAARARIAARIEDGDLLVEVVDDGRGARGAPGPGGHGLAGMAERVRLLGGTLTTRSEPGAGFTVRARLPVRLPQESAE
jgi:signal transduction histidine kinase